MYKYFLKRYTSLSKMCFCNKNITNCKTLLLIILHLLYDLLFSVKHARTVRNKEL